MNTYRIGVAFGAVVDLEIQAEDEAQAAEMAVKQVDLWEFPGAHRTFLNYALVDTVREAGC